MTDPNRLIRAKDILAAPEVRRLCGIKQEDRHTIKRWTDSKGFPEPFRTFRRKKGQDLKLWAREDVKAWLKANPPVSNLIEPEPEFIECPECGMGSRDGSLHLKGCSRIEPEEGQ